MNDNNGTNETEHIEEVPVSNEIANYLSDWADEEELSREEVAGGVIERAVNDYLQSNGFEMLETIHSHDRSHDTEVEQGDSYE